MTVSRTILDQLGGNRFAVMTGAKSFVGSDNALSFRLPSNFARDGINAVRVTLDPSDTYTVRFMRVRGTKITDIATTDTVYCDDLQSTFTRITGLDTNMGRVFQGVQS